ncbi:MAG: hypothetical protein EBR74_11135 [Flavobacteriia bacterium]|nr:hypothetical protein [Flavobacteriia bacterium]
MLVLGIKSMGKRYGERFMPLVHHAFPYPIPLSYSIFPIPLSENMARKLYKIILDNLSENLGTDLVGKTWHENCCRFFLTKNFRIIFLTTFPKYDRLILYQGGE